MKADPRELGQFIPTHYHANMLNDEARMTGFREAINYLVPEGGKVVELGGGTAVMSYFAAQRASQVWCVEFNPDLVKTARSLLAQNTNGDRVEVVHADASLWMPPEPVDVVICEMMHTGLLREQQVHIIHNFKKRYLETFGGPLPAFIPEACLQAVQAIEQDFSHESYYAPCLQFQNPVAEQPRTRVISNPALYQVFRWDEAIPMHCACDDSLVMEHDGTVNAVRIITKNVLAILEQEERSVDWHNQYMIVPLPEPIQVKIGDRLDIKFDYAPGSTLAALTSSLRVKRVNALATQSSPVDVDALSA